jgi:diacylglycerol kinase family enzyme
MPIVSAEVIINSRSGFLDKEAERRRLDQLFAAGGVQARISIARSSEELLEMAKQAARGNSQVVVAGGGDGTINTVAAALIGTDKILGVLPFGTLNHFAQDLRLPIFIADAARVIIAGHAIGIDVGDVNGHIFINNSSLGLYPIMVHERLRQQRLGFRKWPAFVWASLTVLRRYPFLSVELEAHGQRMHSRTPFVFVGNNEYAMEGFKIGRRERFNAGRLSVYMTHRASRLRLVRLGLRALFGRLRSERDFMSLSTDELKIETHHQRLRVALDGEVILLRTPLEYRIRPGALRVIVPE